MIVVKVRDRDIKAAPMGPVTTGSVGLPVSWHFDEAWDDLAKTAVFRVGNDGTEITVAVLEDLCLVPDELLVQANAGENLWIGVYGWDGEDDGEGNATIAMPTIWTYTRIQDGSQPSGIEPPEGTPGWSAQIQNATNEALRVAHGVAADAAAGEFDGISPEVTISDITHGHGVTITDRDHPTGQSFPVLDGASAYEQAVAGGYTRTEAQFNEELGSFKELSEQAADSADSAALSAFRAQNYERHAGDAESAARAYAEIALTRMNSANASAQAAAGSATSAASSATAAEAALESIPEALIKVSPNQPTEPVNKLWINDADDPEYVVPTYDEFVNLKSAVNDISENTINLINPDEIITGNLVKGSVQTGTNYITGYIPVDPSTAYIYSGNCEFGSNEVAYYDSDHRYINRAFAVSFTTPANCAYVRVELLPTVPLDEAQMQLEKGSTATPYVPFLSAVDAVARADVGKINSTYASFNANACTTIANGTDYNTITTPGNYRVTNTANAQTMINCPVEAAHILIVGLYPGGTRPYQILISYEYSMPIWCRHRVDVAWNKLINSQDTALELFPTEVRAAVARAAAHKTAKTLTFGWCSDNHYRAAEQNNKTVPLLGQASKEAGAAFIANTGDIIDGGKSSDQLYPDLVKFWHDEGECYLPVVYAIGHHELYGANGESGLVDGTDTSGIPKKVLVGYAEPYSRYFSKVTDANDPSNYYIDYDNYRLIAVDSIEGSTAARGFSLNTVNFISTTLAANKVNVLFTHVPPLSGLITNTSNSVERGQNVHNALSAFVGNGGTVIVFCGHTHSDYQRIVDGVPYITIDKANVYGRTEDGTVENGYGTANIWKRENGKYTEILADIVTIDPDAKMVYLTRLGAGVDRTVDYN